MTHRISGALTLALTLAGCQLISGLSGLHEGTGTSSSAGGAGGGSSTSSSSSSSSTGGSSSSSSSSSSTSSSSSSSGSTSSSSSSSSGGTCANGVLGDESNCGECGHDCGGGNCTNNQFCTPYQWAILDTAPGLPVDIAADDKNVYWANSSQIHVVEVASTSEINIIGGAAPKRIAAAKQVVFWIDVGAPAIRRINADGSGLLDLTDTMLDADAIATNATHVYWSDPTAGRIFSVPLLGGSVEHIVTTVNGPHELAVDTAAVYWSDGSVINRTTAPNTTSIAGGVADFAFIAADPDPSGKVLWTTGKAKPGVWVAAKQGNSTSNAAQFALATFPGPILADAKNAYWVDALQNTCGEPHLYYRPLAATAVASAKIGPVPSCEVRLAQDASALYWIDGTKLMRMVKPL